MLRISATTFPKAATVALLIFLTAYLYGQVDGFRPIFMPDLPQSAHPEMIRVPPGSMIVPRPEGWKGMPASIKTTVLEVGAYHLDTAEVTNDQYRKCVEAGACVFPNMNDWNLKKGGDHPIVNVSWEQATAYCKWAGKRLPTDAEWEYAARAGLTSELPEKLDDYAWYRRNSGWTNNYPAASEPPLEGGPYSGTTTHPVGTRRPNAWGFYDLLGNAWEWTSTPVEAIAHPFLFSADFPPDSGNLHYIAGGSWYSFDSYLFFSFRAALPPDRYGITIGFRCARD